MKDIEKIKSEDLACQVADANPANFAIEQEVAQLVGATVPQPTEPSADDARELGAQLLVFLRRALLPIQTALRTAVAAIYAHLDSRCTDYTPAAYAPYIPRPYDPMGSTPRTLPNLLTALTPFSARKISNGSAPNDGIKDGVSLVHLLCQNSATKLVDDNYGWAYSVANKAASLFSLFASADDVTFGFGSCTADFLTSSANATKMRFPALKTISCTNFIGTGGNPGNPTASWATTHLYFDSLETATNLVRYYGNGWWNEGMMNLQHIYLPKLKRIYSGGTAAALFQGKCPSLTSLEMPELETMDLPLYGGETLAGLTELRMPKLKYMNVALCSGTYPSANGLPNLQLLEVGPVQTNMDVRYWNPTDKGTTFLQNFREHILSRLSTTGGNYTLTLSQDVRDAIHDGGLDQYKPSNWTITPNPTNT